MFLLCISTVFLGLGYAAVSNITLELEGSTNVKKIDYIKITNINYKEDVSANSDESKINNYYASTFNSKIVLGDNIDSSISYLITVRNDTDNAFKYIDTIHDNSSIFYDNQNIEYIVSGIEQNDII